MPNGNGRNTNDDLEQALTGGQPYPVFTIPMKLDDSGTDAGPAGSADADVGAGWGRLVTGTLRDLLGWSPNTADPAGFQSALGEAIDLENFEGHVRFTLKPRSFSVLTNLEGGVTGAQASVHERARRAVDEAVKLLDLLYPLRVDADPEDVAAIKALVRQHLQELVGELGRLGGPRVLKVDQIFQLLLDVEIVSSTGDSQAAGKPAAKGTGAGAVAPTSEKVAGEVGNLRDQLGLKFKRVNTVEEEENLTQYRLLADYITDLRLAWNANRSFFTRGKHAVPFFGTQLVHLSRLLTVIAEQIGEVRFAFNSVFIGPRERQTLEVTPRLPEMDVAGQGPGGYLPAYAHKEWRALVSRSEQEKRSHEADPIYLEDALSWIEGFARQDGPRLIREAGKLGVEHAFVPIARNLKHLVAGLRWPAHIDSLPAGYQTLRVEHALFELQKQFDTLLRAAGGLDHEPHPGFIQEAEPAPTPAPSGMTPPPAAPAAPDKSAKRP
jgi:hypothetical protein